MVLSNVKFRDNSYTFNLFYIREICTSDKTLLRSILPISFGRLLWTYVLYMINELNSILSKKNNKDYKFIIYKYPVNGSEDYHKAMGFTSIEEINNYYIGNQNRQLYDLFSNEDVNSQSIEYNALNESYLFYIQNPYVNYFYLINIFLSTKKEERRKQKKISMSIHNN